MGATDGTFSKYTTYHEDCDTIDKALVKAQAAIAATSPDLQSVHNLTVIGN